MSFDFHIAMREEGSAGGIDREPETTMPNYEINYLHHDGSLACKFEAQCEDDTHAKVLAHAMSRVLIYKILP